MTGFQGQTGLALELISFCQVHQARHHAHQACCASDSHYPRRITKNVSLCQSLEPGMVRAHFLEDTFFPTLNSCSVSLNMKGSRGTTLSQERLQRPGLLRGARSLFLPTGLACSARQKAYPGGPFPGQQSHRLLWKCWGLCPQGLSIFPKQPITCFLDKAIFIPIIHAEAA